MSSSTSLPRSPADASRPRREAAPPRAVIEGADLLGIDLTHVYGLTEVYGPAAVCAQHPEWEELSLEERAQKNGRQGVRYVVQEGMDVLDPVTQKAVARDGKTMGEICFRGNITMKGYLKNQKATEKTRGNHDKTNQTN